MNAKLPKSNPKYLTGKGVTKTIKAKHLYRRLGPYVHMCMCKVCVGCVCVCECLGVCMFGLPE